MSYVRDLPNANKLKTHCRYGHPLSGGNMRLNAKGARVCLSCRGSEKDLACNREYRRRMRRAGKIRNGYTAEGAARSLGRNGVEKVFEVVRETGRTATAFAAVNESAARAFFHFNPKLRIKLLKLTFKTPRTIVCAPAILLRPEVAADILARISAAVPPHLPRDMRLDVVGAMTVALYEERLALADIERRAREFVAESFKHDHNKYGPRSLDAAISHDNETPLIDTITTGLWS